MDVMTLMAMRLVSTAVVAFHSQAASVPGEPHTFFRLRKVSWVSWMKSSWHKKTRVTCSKFARLVTNILQLVVTKHFSAFMGPWVKSPAPQNQT